MRYRSIALLILFFSAISVFSQEKESKHFKITKNLDIYNSLFKELELFYVDSIDVEKMVQTSIEGMLVELDPYTVYIPASENESLEYLATGQYGGVGALISQREDYVVISEPYEGTPAQKSGLKAGDIIMEINGEKMKGKTISEVSERLRGEPGETLEIVVERPGEKKSLKKEITREKIQTKPIEYYSIYENIGYIYFNNFTDKSAAEFKKVLLELKVKQQLEGLIIDLRGNPGGIVEEAVLMCNYFLPKGQEIVSLKGKDKQWDRSFRTIREPLDIDIPVVVLVNQESASASEIVAGALQDLDRAVIIGNRTYGKGLVQTPRPIGYEGYLKVTSAKYYTPSGRCIQAIDYEHKNNGRAEKIPDSLRNEFKTANGRTVKDGGGIEPDITLEQPELPDITYRLYGDYMIFDYATAYCSTHPAPASMDAFKLTEKDFEDFKTFLKNKDFSYQLRSNTMLNSLKEIIKFEGYEDMAQAEIEALEKKLQPDTDRDIDINKEAIIELLSTEIMKRYFFKRGEINELLKNDDGLKKAIEVIKNKEEYNSILSL